MIFLFEKDTWQEVYDSIRKNKLRTIITIIGVVWGIFLLVALLGSAKGMENSFNRAFSNFATNSIFIFGGTTGKPFKGFQKGKKVALKLRDVPIIQNEIEGIEFVTPRLGRNGVTMTKGFLSGAFPLNGDYPSFERVQKIQLSYGRFINESDIQEKRKVVIISEDVYKQLFEKDVEAVGENILIDKISFKVVGVFKKGKAINLSEVHIPFTTFQQIYNTGGRTDWVIVTGKKEANIKQIEKDTKVLLRNLHNIHPEDERSLELYNIGKNLSKVIGFLKGMQFLTWFVGISTLIAGVFAIGNILLVTVKERTQEIGIRRAIGATPADIRKQIILEAVFLSVSAGIFGIISGGLLLMLVDKIWGQGYNASLVNPSVSIPVVLTAIAILTTLGAIMGLIPANKAVKIRPIEALSNE